MESLAQLGVQLLLFGLGLELSLPKLRAVWGVAVLGEGREGAGQGMGGRGRGQRGGELETHGNAHGRCAAAPCH